MPTEDPLEFDHFYSHTHWDHISGLPRRVQNSCPRRPPYLARWYRGGLAPVDARTAFSRAAGCFCADIDFSDFTAGDTLDLRDGVVVKPLFSIILMAPLATASNLKVGPSVM